MVYLTITLVLGVITKINHSHWDITTTQHHYFLQYIIGEILEHC